MTTEDPSVVKLSDMPEVGDLSLPGQQSAEKPEDLIKVLPEQLQSPILDFMRNLAKNIIAQQTTSEGDVKITSNQVEFYKGRFGEVLDSGLLNPHINPPKKIS